MLVKVIYIILFAITDLLIWLVLNKPTAFNKTLRYLLAVLFALFVIVHTGVLRWPFLLPWNEFFKLIVITCVPVLLFSWYTGIEARRVKRNYAETQFGEGLLQITRIIFLYAINVAAFVLQVLMVLGYHVF